MTPDERLQILTGDCRDILPTLEVGRVAIELGRRAVLIELNSAYVALAEARTNVTPGFL
jgi:hypothetical protein